MIKHLKENFDFYLINLLLFIIILLAFFIRFDNLDKHFAHVDDLISPRIAVFNSDSFIDKIDKRVDLSNSQKDILSTIYPFVKPFVVAGSISMSSTYAPFQFIVTGAIVNEKMSYKDILFYSRLISFIAGFLTIILLLHLFSRLYGKNNVSYALFGITILSLSWQHIIYSMQSNSYAIGVFVAILSFILYCIYITKENISKKESLYLGLILSILIFTNYQLLLFLPGFYLSILMSYKGDYKKFFSSYLLSIIIVIFSTLALYIIFLSSRASQGVNWNIGRNQEFLFDISSQNSFIDSIKYIISFFLENTYYVFMSLISFANEGNIINNIFTIIYMLLFTVGLFSFYNSQSILKKNFVFFFLTTSLVWVLLILMQKITLSPTRHSLILLSFILVFTPAGLIYILEKYKLPKNYIMTIISILLISIFSYNYTLIMSKRLDKFNPIYMERLIKKFNITEIYEYGLTWNLNFMQYVKNNFEIKDTPRGEVYLMRKKVIINNNILFIAQGNHILSKKIKNNFLVESGRSLETPLKLIYKEEHQSTTQVSVGNQTKNGTNSLFLYIFEIGDN
jgi:hypothetical protein